MKYEFESIKKDLYTAVIADILDELGYREQVMKSDIRPVCADMRLVGRAFTVLAADVYAEPEKPYKMELEAVDRLSADDIVTVTTNGSVSSGFWGELLTTVAVCKGATGAVIDGFTRDTTQIMKMGFPLFVRGMCALDSKGRTDVIAYQVPIVCGGVRIRPGDILFADFDGVVVIPQEVADETFEKAFNKVNGENIVREEILAGASATEVFERHHIL